MIVLILSFGLTMVVANLIVNERRFSFSEMAVILLLTWAALIVILNEVEYVLS